MSKEEAQDMTLRELVRHNLTMLEQVKKEADDRTRMLYDISGDIRVFAEQNKSHAKYIIDNSRDIRDLKVAHNNLKETQDNTSGAVKLAAWLGGIGGISGLGALFINWLKH